MKPIEYLRLQAKNLHKYFKTQIPSFDPELRRNVYEYDPRFFKIDLLIDDFNIDEEKFTLMNAQHIVAKLCGLEKWADLTNASPAKIELSILLYTNMDKLEKRDWEQYISEIETTNNVKLDDEFKLQIFKEGFLDWQEYISYDDYRLSRDDENEIEWVEKDIVSGIPLEQISSLPLNQEERDNFIEAANHSFERVFKHIEPENPALTLTLWDAEKFIYEVVLTPDRLPIDRNYALSLIDAAIVHHVIELATDADKSAVECN